MFYHRLLLNTVKNAKLRKKIARITLGEVNDRCRVMNLDRYLLSLLESIELLPFQNVGSAVC